MLQRIVLLVAALGCCGFVLAAAGVAAEIPVPLQTFRQRYAVAPSGNTDGEQRGELLNTRAEYFDARGRLIRWEERAPDGAHVLTWVGVFFGAELAPRRGAYWNRDEQLPFSELFVHSADGRMQDVYYGDYGNKLRRQMRRYLDAAGREIYQEYFAPRSQKMYSEEIYRYDADGNESGRHWRRFDGRAQRDTRFEIAARDAHGRWTERRVHVDGALEAIDVREIVYGDARAPRPAAAAGPVASSPAILVTPFAAGVISSSASGENALTFTPDGRTTLFTRYADRWESQQAFTSTWRDGAWREPEALGVADSMYNAAFSSDGTRIIYCVRDDALASARVFTVARGDSGWLSPTDWTAKAGFTGSYFRWLAGGALYFHRDGDLRRCVLDDAGVRNEVALPAPINTPDGTEFGAWVDEDETLLLFTRYVEGQPERTGVFVAERRADAWEAPRKLAIPYGWSAVLTPDGEDLIYVVDDDIVRVPVVLLDLPDRATRRAGSLRPRK